MEILVTILLLLIPVNSAAVKKNLTSTEGGNVTFPDPLQQTGFLLFGTQVIAMVVNGGLNIPQNVFRDRILRNSSTGALTLTGLQRTDSGDYSIQSVVDDVSSRFLYELKVYETVPVPSVDRVSNDSCVLLCSVGAAEETTLSWYKDVELVKSSSSAASLDLSLQRDDFSAEYKCVAAKPVEKKPVSVHVHTLCPEVSEHNTGRYVVLIVFIVISLLLLALFILLYRKRKKRKQSKGSVKEEEVEYSDFIIRQRLNPEGSPPDAVASDRPPLINTLYAKLELHQMKPDHTTVGENV
ncbi:CD48 antigen-like [Cynoglossus semilaevis]|uniref:CD48 antigen-like n=1 Tax=Cynoglossus semilaevis TaxID=244447 RepID=UPI000D62D730|nr:CD48 antigen-like [Cynoglossus semilaevis]